MIDRSVTDDDIEAAAAEWEADSWPTMVEFARRALERGDEVARERCERVIIAQRERAKATVQWTGPREEDLAPDGVTLRHPVPPERWPWCLPEEHDRGCKLHRGGLFCDCGASCADDDGVVR